VKYLLRPLTGHPPTLPYPLPDRWAAKAVSSSSGAVHHAKHWRSLQKIKLFYITISLHFWLMDDQVVPWNSWNQLKKLQIIGGGGWTRTNDLRIMSSPQERHTM
jgi:hypothetical protein